MVDLTTALMSLSDTLNKLQSVFGNDPRADQVARAEFKVNSLFPEEPDGTSGQLDAIVALTHEFTTFGRATPNSIFQRALNRLDSLLDEITA